ncbi:MAG: VOC family protein [Acidimicrobiia bacterium]|nr:VOC family protein [Acidimicrobiia bacterium]
MTDRRQHVYVTLRYVDALAAIEWLTQTLGFVEHEMHLADDGTVQHAQLVFGEDLIMLGSTPQPPPGTQTVYLARPDVDEHYAVAVEAGADVTMPITDQDYGSREYAVRDPEGNTWAVGTYQPTAP